MLDEIGEHGKEIPFPAAGPGRYLGLIRRDGKLHAFHNVCPHQCRNQNFAPDRFLVSSNGLLVCAHHGASFDLATGECVGGPCKGDTLRMVEISLQGDEVWLENPDPGS